MKTTSMRTVGAIFTAGILLTSCVSSKKYKASQAAVAKLQADSSSLAQKASSLQQNLTAAEQKSADLQKSVETAGTTNAGLQKNVAYYTDYAGKQQASTNQIKDELTTSLAPAGLTDQDIMAADGKIYINVADKSLFKGNSAVLTAKGKELVNNLGEYVKSHEAVDVSVADLEMATSNAPGDGTATTTTSDKTATGTDNSSSNSTANTASNNNADYANTASKPAKKKVHHAVAHTAKTPVAGESKAITYSSKKKSSYASSRSAQRAIAWKRQNVVADAMLQNGIPKVKLVSQLKPGSNTATKKGVQVVLVNDIDNFYKHMTEAPAAGQPVSKNP